MPASGHRRSGVGCDESRGCRAQASPCLPNVVIFHRMLLQLREMSIPIASAFDAALAERNVEYAGKRRSGRLGEPTVQALSRATTRGFEPKGGGRRTRGAPRTYTGHR